VSTEDDFETRWAAERAERLEWLRGIWPAGADLNPSVLATGRIEGQVEWQNKLIEEQVESLINLFVKVMADFRRTGALRELVEPFKLGTQLAIEGDDYYTSATAEGIESGLDLIYLPIEFNKSIRVAYGIESRQAVVEYQLPDVTIVPKAQSFRYVKSRGQIIEVARPASQIGSLYTSVVAQLTLICLVNIFHGDSHGMIDAVVFNGVVESIDRRNGQPVRPCLITVRVTRETFAGINLEHVDPLACLKHLSAGVSKSPTELVPVRPVLELSMVDPRFIAEIDAVAGLDDRPNLLELNWREFESLIQNLFTQMGLDARQTRPSRDGGVDCVAYDTRPIFGGKIVIQAKRYKNTVGVSAVRDLYGTLQNEGASKGILVTTSGYGAASFDFANNKPIELIDGANLLYLLEENLGITARIEPPDDWRDPNLDSPPVNPED
jgi:restriction system protein